MSRLILSIALLAYLPGALIYRWPAWGRERRAALTVEERLFWHVVISVAWSVGLAFALAAFDRYRLSRVLIANGALSALILAGGRARLFYRGQAARPSLSLLLPIALVALGCWRFFPSSEYIIGGKDPGVYINEGVELAKSGSLAIREPVVAAVPAGARDLFFHDYHRGEYYSIRFMGFFMQDPATGRSIGQFPHLYPASIALAYDLDGLPWALGVVGAWAVLGVLALYFAGARFLGPGVAFAASALLTLQVLEVWFARSPGSEPATQALLLAGILAFARAHQDADRFFGPVAGLLLGLLLFLRLDGFMAIAAVGGAALCTWIVTGLRPRIGFLVPLAVACIAGWFYVTWTLRAYSMDMVNYLRLLPTNIVLVAAVGFMVGVALLARLVRLGGDLAARVVPFCVAAVVLAGVTDAWFFRHQIDCQSPCLKLAAPDAYALRTFTDFYFTRWALVLSLAGLLVVLRRRLWRDPAFVLTITGFALAFFYKIHIQPFQFWLNRRFLPAVLPGMLLFAAFAALGSLTRPWRIPAAVRTAVGVVVLCVLGWHYAAAAVPIIPHVEYSGMIGNLRELASMFTERDLVIVESRDSGTDIHVLATPLDYLLDRRVLVLERADPDKAMLRAFLEQASGIYPHIYFIGGGTDVLSRHILARPITTRKFLTPEYEDVPWNVYPNDVRTKVFDFGVYELSLGNNDATGGFSHTIGAEDDLYVLRFHSRDFNQGTPMRWTTAQSYIDIPGMTGKETEVVLTMHDGGRPKQAPPAHVEVWLDDVRLGASDVTGPDFHPYRFAVPTDLARAAGTSENTARIRLVSNVWNPKQLLGTTDDRDLGVMVSRVEVH